MGDVIKKTISLPLYVGVCSSVRSVRDAGLRRRALATLCVGVVHIQTVFSFFTVIICISLNKN